MLPSHMRKLDLKSEALEESSESALDIEALDIDLPVEDIINFIHDSRKKHCLK